MTYKVDPAVRRSNTRAVENRAQWRTRYSQITKMIRLARSHLRSDPNNSELMLLLDSLRMRANLLMLEREFISHELRRTAYVWV
jgi:hypothetical protein